MRFFLLSALFFLQNICFSQGDDTVSCNSQNRQLVKNVEAYINGKRGKADIARKFLSKMFEIKLSDPSFEIIKFQMVWDNRRSGNLYSRPNLGGLVKPELEDPGIPNRENYSLKKIIPGSILTFEDFVIKKGLDCYSIPSTLVYVTL